MRLAGVLAASTVLLPLLLVLGASPSCHGASSHNITAILAAHPDLAEFSAALASTGAAAEIDRHNPVTVLAVGNDVMAQIKAQQLQPKDLEHVIYLHVLWDYLDAAKLRTLQGGSVQSTSLYQAAGKAHAAEGMVNVTVFRDGRVAFALSGNDSTAPPPAAFYKQSVKESPYDIAVLQVSAPIWSPAPAAGAPAPAPPAHAPTPPALPPVVAPATPPTPASSPASSPTPPAVAPVVAPATPPTPASSPASAPAPALAPASSPASAAAPTPPAFAPAVAPATAPTPRRRPAPAPEDTIAPSPDADTEPPADQKNNGARDTASWSLGTAVAAAVPAIVLLLLW